MKNFFRKSKAGRFCQKHGWIVLTACLIALFVSSAAVYYAAVPRNVTALLPMSGSLSYDELMGQPGDLEIYPYVTKVYEYGTDADRLDIVVKGSTPDWRVPHAVMEDAAAPYNIYVECFVWSDIADKALVARLWNVSVREENPLYFVERRGLALPDWLNQQGDLKRQYFFAKPQYTTFLRISVRPGFNNVRLSDMNEDVTEKSV